MKALNTKTPWVCTELAVSCGLLATLAGARDVSFIAPGTLLAGNSPSLVAVADFNGDGLLDLAAANSGSIVSPSFWATGMGVSKDRGTSQPISGRLPLRWATSMATGFWTWPWPTP